jgi:hypothetical protein
MCLSTPSLSIKRRVDKFVCIKPWISNIFVAKDQTRYCGLARGPRFGDPCVQMKDTGDQKVSVHLMITVQKTRKNILKIFNH